MADIIRKVAYFAMDVANKPGEGARLLGALADQGVNMLAFSGFPSGRKAQLDFVPEDVAAFKTAAKDQDAVSKVRISGPGRRPQGSGGGNPKNAL